MENSDEPVLILNDVDRCTAMLGDYMDLAQQNIDRFVSTAAEILPSMAGLQELVGSAWLSTLQAREPGDGLHPLLDLLWVVPGSQEAQVMVDHIDSVVQRWKQSTGFDTRLLTERIQPRLIAKRIEGYKEWHSVITEIFLRDFLEQRGLSATLTRSGPDIQVNQGTGTAWLEVYTPMRMATEEYVSNLLWLAIDRQRPVDILWSYRDSEPVNLGTASASQFLRDMGSITQGTLPYSGTVQFAKNATLYIEVSEYPYPHVRKVQSEVWASLAGLQDWLTQAITTARSSMQHKFTQLSQNNPSILVIAPGNSTKMANQLSALGLGHPDPWGTFQWPADLPPQCVGILLWWYQLGTSEPWQARLLVPRSAPSLPLWLHNALNTPAIEVADAQSGGR